MSYRGPCDKGLFPRQGLLGDYENFQGWDLEGDVQVIGGMLSKGVVGPWAVPPSLFYFPALRLVCLFCRMLLL